MLLYIKKIQMSINVDLLWLRYSFFRQSQPSMLNETHMMQQIQQLSQTIQKSEELNRQKILQQQQAEFDQQIGHVCAPLNFKFIYINILNIFKNLQYNFHWCCFLQMGGMPPQMHMQHDPLHHQMAHQMPPGYGHVMPPDQAQQIFPPQDIDERPHLPPVPPPDEEDDQRDRRDREDRRHRRSRHDRSRSRSVKDTRDVHNFKMMFLDRLFLLFLHLTC